MIRLHRGPEPGALTRYRDRWTNRLRRIVTEEGRGDWSTTAARRHIRNALGPMSFEKCAYCEGRLDAQSLKYIEHYVARAVDLEMAFAWTNLFLVCSACNELKGGTDHHGVLLKPDDETPECDPERFFWLNGEGELEPHPRLSPAEAARASETIRVCKLNRGGLCKDRSDLWKVLRGLLALTPGERAGDLQDSLDARLAPAFPYRFVIRRALSSCHQDALVEHDRICYRQRA